MEIHLIYFLWWKCMHLAISLVMNICSQPWTQMLTRAKTDREPFLSLPYMLRSIAHIMNLVMTVIISVSDSCHELLILFSKRWSYWTNSSSFSFVTWRDRKTDWIYNFSECLLSAMDPEARLHSPTRPGFIFIASLHVTLNSTSHESHHSSYIFWWCRSQIHAMGCTISAVMNVCFSAMDPKACLHSPSRPRIIFITSLHVAHKSTCHE
jgi:hypothetical protein